MTKKLSTKNMVITALLIAFGILIPTAFSSFRIPLGPFTATFASHVPTFIAMFISPVSAICAAIGTTIGFIITAPLVVVVRAASHIIFALVGSYMLKKNCSIILTGIITAVLHAGAEAIVVALFITQGWTSSQNTLLSAVFYVTGLGTLIHHTIDYIIAVVLIKALAKTGAITDLPKLF